MRNNFFQYILYFTYCIFFRNRYKKNQLIRTEKIALNTGSLQGFDKHKCIFIHIPKAAGVSLSQNLFGNLGGGHRKAIDYYKIYSPLEFRRYFKFTIVRNPWDRLVSAYLFLKQGGFNEGDRIWFQNNLSEYNNFEEFVENWITKKNVMSFTHFIPQYIYITGYWNFILVDKIYKFEFMDEMYIDLNNRLNVTLSNVKKNTNLNRVSNYQTYYNDKTRKIVAETYEKDIKLFNYEF
tara:strand:- start:1539 stop:2246 length:708 start_codon:yes stop_codon:yes gene_type:complete